MLSRVRGRPGSSFVSGVADVDAEPAARLEDAEDVCPAGSSRSGAAGNNWATTPRFFSSSEGAGNVLRRSGAPFMLYAWPRTEALLLRVPLLYAAGAPEHATRCS